MRWTKRTLTLLYLEEGLWKKSLLCLLRVIFSVHFSASSSWLTQLTSAVDWKDHGKEPSNFPSLSVKKSRRIFRRQNHIQRGKKVQSTLHNPWDCLKQRPLKITKNIFVQSWACVFQLLKTLVLSKTKLSLWLLRILFPERPRSKTFFFRTSAAGNVGTDLLYLYSFAFHNQSVLSLYLFCENFFWLPFSLASAIRSSVLRRFWHVPPIFLPFHCRRCFVRLVLRSWIIVNYFSKLYKILSRLLFLHLCQDCLLNSF